MKLHHIALGIALAAAPLAACGGDGETAQEAKVEQARLQEFVPLLPAAPKPFTALGPKFETGDAKSMVSQVYQTPEGDAFSIEITFSNAEVAKFQAMLDEVGPRNKASASLTQVNGRNALTFSAPTATRAQYVMVVSPSRMVSATPIAGDTIKPIMSYAFGQIDFDAVAAK